MSDKIRVIFFQDGDKWLAQGLEHDICVQANNIDDLYGRFEVTVKLEEMDGKLDHIPPAPTHFQKLWDRKSGDFQPINADDSQFEVVLAA